MALEKRVERLEQQGEAAEQPSNVVMYDPNIPGDLERKQAAWDGSQSVIFIPYNGREEAQDVHD